MAKAKGGYGIADSIEATPKKTRQGNSNNTKYGTKPLTHLGPVPKKTLNKYKKRK